MLSVAAFALITGIVGLPPQSRAAPQGGRPVRILFIGNSYTYFNNLPQILQALGHAADERIEVRYRIVAEGGATLQDHWEGGSAREAIAGERWDYVVLQEQSTLGDTYLVEGKERVASSDRFVAHATLLVEDIRRNGARPVLFAHWKRADAPMRDQQALDAAFKRLVTATNIMPAPVGAAWHFAAARRPGLELYDDDGSHPAAAGSYLAACTLYATILGRSPVGLPARVEGNPVDEDSGIEDAGADVMLVDLSAGDAAAIQQAAWQASEGVRSRPESLGPDRAPPIRLPRAPAGRSFVPADIVGAWAGEARHYPDFVTWPATMRLQVESDGDGLRGQFTLGFGGQPEDIVRSVEIVRTEGGFEFVDPEGPNGGIVRYRGVFTGEALSGIGEILVEGAPLYAIGSWRLVRVPGGGPST